MPLDASPSTPQAANPFLKEAWETARTLAAGLAIALVLRVVVFQPNTIPSSSMEPGVVTGDYLLISKWPYGWGHGSLPFNPPLFNGRLFDHAPKRGDVIVFHGPRDLMIKRLIGLPGDRVQVIRGQVFVNGKPNPRRFEGWTRDHDDPARAVPRVVETSIDGRKYLTYGASPDAEGDNTDVYLVPQGRYFFMGDNRDNSLDSRWPEEIGVGFVPEEDLVGRAEMVILSWKQGASVLKPWTWLDLDPQRFFLRVK